MMHLLCSQDHFIRDLAANIVPKIAGADWPNDWPGFLPQLSSVIADSNDTNQIISVLKVLRGILSSFDVDYRIHFGDIDR
jgi:hypothetical protein